MFLSFQRFLKSANEERLDYDPYWRIEMPFSECTVENPSNDRPESQMMKRWDGLNARACDTAFRDGGPPGCTTIRKELPIVRYVYEMKRSSDNSIEFAGA